MGFTEVKCGAMTVMQADNLTGRVSHAFTTRLGGFSKGVFSSLNLAVNRGDDKPCVTKNFGEICKFIGTEPSKLVFSCQVHKDDIRAVTEKDSKGDIFSETGYEADGLITDRPELPLIIFMADCIPVLLYGSDVPAVGAVHAGWRGTVLNIAGQAVRKMQKEYGCRPENIVAAIGPGIGRCCFETGPEVPEAVRKLGLDSQENFIDMSTGRPHVDLKAVNRALLIREGLRPENIAVSGECTMCKSDKYWSHRATRGKRGAQAALIMLP